MPTPTFAEGLRLGDALVDGGLTITVVEDGKVGGDIVGDTRVGVDVVADAKLLPVAVAVLVTTAPSETAVVSLRMADVREPVVAAAVASVGHCQRRVDNGHGSGVLGRTRTEVLCNRDDVGCVNRWVSCRAQRDGAVADAVAEVRLLAKAHVVCC